MMNLHYQMVLILFQISKMKLNLSLKSPKPPEASQTMKLYVAQKKLIGKTNNGEKVPSLEAIEVVLVQCNLVDYPYQQKYEVLYTSTPSLNDEPSNLLFMKT